MAKSIIDILRDQKKKLESGQSMNPEVGAGKKYKDPTNSNSTSNVVKRGYSVHKMDEEG